MTWICIPSTCSQAREGGYWQIGCSDIPQSAPWKSKNIPAEFFCKDNLTEFYQSFPFGTMLLPSGKTTPTVLASSPEQRRCSGNSSFVAGSLDHARTSVLPVMDPGLAANVQGCGEKWQGSFVKFDRDTSSWRTHQCSLLGDWERFSGTWPEWGLMRNGECLALNTLALPTTGIESGSLPTPTRTDYKGGRKRETAEACGRNERNNLRDYCRQILGWTRPYPDASESLMLWPIGWTDLKPLGMDKFQAWLDSRGRY